MLVELRAPGIRLQVGGWAQLECDPAVLHPLGDRTERDVRVLPVFAVELDVFGDAYTVAEPQGAPIEQGAADALDTVGLTGVHGHRQVVPREVVECVAHPL